MDIGEIVSDAVRYPSSDWKKVIILGIFSVISILIIPAFLVMGYVFRVLKVNLAGSDELPEFEEWGEMFIDGLKFFVVGIAYLIIPVIVIFAGIWASLPSIFSVMATGTITVPSSLALLVYAMIIGIILAIIFGLIAIIAFTNMARHDSELGAAFRFSEILDRISLIGWGKYFIWYIVMIIFGIVAGIIAVTLRNIIPYIGYIIAYLIVYPYLYMLYARSLALIIRSSEEAREEPAEKPATE